VGGKRKKLDPMTEPVRIADDEVYTIEAARLVLGVPGRTLRREVRDGRLRVAKVAGRYLVPGPWLRDYVTACEVKRHRKAA
jgi:hypothetical protein